jgi:hypothetical protein
MLPVLRSHIWKGLNKEMRIKVTVRVKEKGGRKEGGNKEEEVREEGGRKEGRMRKEGGRREEGGRRKVVE